MYNDINEKRLIIISIMLMRINEKLEEININDFITDDEYYKYVMTKMKNYLNAE